MSNPSRTFGPVSVYFGEKNGKYPDGNQVVVTGPEGKAIFDTPLSAHALAASEDNPLDGAALLILGHAHEDHCAGMHLLPGAEVFAPEADLGAVQSVEGMMAHYGYSPEALRRMRVKIAEDFHFLPRPDAVGYGDGRVWELGGGVTVRAVHMPGHTGGHSVLLVEPGGIAFIGDIDLTGFGPYYGDACSHLPAFLDTLERIRSLEARVWITFHHKGAITDRETFLGLLDAFTGRIHQREEAIVAAIGAGGMTLEQLVAHRFLYPPGYTDVYVEDAERKTLREHLALLLAGGRVREEGGVYWSAES